MAAFGLMLALVAPFALAQTGEPAGSQQADQDQDKQKEEYAVYKNWYDANAAKDFPKAMGFAKEYLEKFPQGQYADYLKKWIPQARIFLFNEAIKSKNTEAMLSIAKEAIGQDSNDLFYLYWTAANLRQNELSASSPNYQHADLIADYAQRAIPLIEADNIPTGVDKAKWNKKEVLGYLYETQALIAEHNKDTDKAIEYYGKAQMSEPSKPSYSFNCGRLHQEKYLAAVQKYQGMPEEDRNAPEAEMKPEVKAALENVNKQADGVINCWARFLAQTAEKNPYGPETRSKVEKALTDLYEYRHPGQPEGLQKLIEQYRTGNASATTSESSTASTNL